MRLIHLNIKNLLYLKRFLKKKRATTLPLVKHKFSYSQAFTMPFDVQLLESNSIEDPSICELFFLFFLSKWHLAMRINSISIKCKSRVLHPPIPSCHISFLQIITNKSLNNTPHNHTHSYKIQ